MAVYPIAETFLSINGEGTRSGQLAYFIRFPVCNLHCSFCDTRWACKDGDWEQKTTEELVELVKSSGAELVTLTGGEPMLQPELRDLIETLTKECKVLCEIETNGSIDISEYDGPCIRPSFTLDCKLPGSGMEEHMLYSNYNHLRKTDTVKFVCGSAEDLDRAREIIDRFDLTSKCTVFLSPVFGSIEPADMVTYMTEHKMSKVRLQLQIHKFIWDPEEKGV